MSITRSYNKHTNTYYAYETSYVWDEKAQKKVQKKQCIGKFDPETDKVIPNGKRGRPRGSASTNELENTKYAEFISDARRLSKRLKSIESSFEKLSSEVVQLSVDLDSLLTKIQSKEHS
jgi:hypothetical protein